MSLHQKIMRVLKEDAKWQDAHGSEEPDATKAIMGGFPRIKPFPKVRMEELQGAGPLSELAGMFGLGEGKKPAKKRTRKEKKGAGPISGVLGLLGLGLDEPRVVKCYCGHCCCDAAPEEVLEGEGMMTGGKKKALPDALQKYQAAYKVLRDDGFSHAEARQILKKGKEKHGGGFFDSLLKGVETGLNVAKAVGVI